MKIARIVFKNPLTLWIKWLTTVLCYQYKYKRNQLSIGYLASLNNCRFGAKNTVYDKAELFNVIMDDYSYIGPYCRIINARIGKFTCIAPETIIGLGKHPSREFVSTHPAFFSPNQQAGFTFVSNEYFKEYEPCIIGNDVWIGARAIILDGVSVGDGAIVGAGAIVTKNVPPYAIIGGVPAKVLRYRFDQDEIDYLIKFKWWDRDFEWLRQNHLLFRDVKKFCTQLTND